jgi:chemotaxis protein MotB
MGSFTGELTGVERVPNLRKSGRPGSATAWVAVVFIAAGGAFAVYEVWGRAKAARAAAQRIEGELVLTRDRAKAAEERAVAAEAALTDEKRARVEETDKLKAENLVLGEEARKTAERAQKADALATELGKSVGKDEGSVKAEAGKLTLDLLDKVLFPTAKAQLTPMGKKVLKRVGAALNKHPDRMIWVIGHTDDVPIKSDEFPSNWELSTARAVAVVHYLVEEVGVDPKRLAAAGFGPYRPVSRSNRSRNRRIELVLFPKDVRLERP